MGEVLFFNRWILQADLISKINYSDRINLIYIVCQFSAGLKAIRLLKNHPILRMTPEPLTSDVGSIRGDFVLNSYQMLDSDKRSVRNLVHASDSPE